MSTPTHRAADRARHGALRVLFSVGGEARKRRQARSDSRSVERDLASDSYYAQVDDLLERIRDERSLEAKMIRSILGHSRPRSNSRLRPGHVIHR